MTDRELMQQALDALDIFYDEYGWGEKQQKAHEALRARLAQPEPEALGEVIPADEEQLKRIAKLIEPEPVWVEVTTNTGDKFILDSAVEADKIRAARDAGLSVVPLYTAPPQREWQGLTQEDKREIIDETEPEDRGYVMALVEAKLKEKNHAN